MGEAEKMDLLGLIMLNVAAIVFFGIFSVLYKDNPAYRAIVALVIGVTAANVLLVNLLSIQNSILSPLVTKVFGTQDWITALLALIVGLAFVTFFTERTRVVYRNAVVLTAGVSLGIAVPYGIAFVWGSVLSIGGGAFTSIPGFVTFAAFVIGMFYFLFAKMFEKPTRPLREVGRLLLILYAAFSLPQMILQNMNMIMYFLLDSVKYGTWWVALVVLIGIIISLIYSRSKSK